MGIERGRAGALPDTHAQLTVQLIGSIRQLFGEAGLDKLIGQREQQAREDYTRACAGEATLPERVRRSPRCAKRKAIWHGSSATARIGC